MKDKNIVRLAWIIGVLIAIASVVYGVIDLSNRAADGNLFETVDSLSSFLMSISFGLMGALIISRQPRNIIGWLLLVEGTFVFVLPLDIYFSSLTQAPTSVSPLMLLALWIYPLLWDGLIFPILFIPLYFPTGRLPSPRWRGVVLLGLALCLFFILFTTFLDELGAQDESWAVPNPVGFLSKESFPIRLSGILLLSFAFLSVASLYERYRSAQSVEREQIRWLMYVASLVFLFYSISSISFFFSEDGGIIWDVAWTGFNLAVLLLPVAIGVAILRHRLYDIDVIIRKSLIYAVLTVLLTLVYLGMIVLLQSVFNSASGQQSPIAIVISTLVIAALFAPLKRRIQAMIDRRLYRKKYDAQQVLDHFAQTARDEVEMAVFQTELLRVVQETMQPSQLSIWLKNEKRN